MKTLILEVAESRGICQSQIVDTEGTDKIWRSGAQTHIQDKAVARMGKRKGLRVGKVSCLMESEEKYTEMVECNCIAGTGKNCLQGKETSHAGISGKPQWVIAETNGGGYHSPGLLYQTLGDLYECSQYYLVNK